MFKGCLFLDDDPLWRILSPRGFRNIKTLDVLSVILQTLQM